MPLNAKIYYRQSNKGDNQSAPIILIHGAGGTHLHWPAQIRRLPGHRVFALDLPGHGKSEGRGIQTIDSYCQSIVEWMDSIHMFQGVIVGHSMGGAIALTMAIQNPERVIALGLVGSGVRLRVMPMILESSSSSATYHIAIRTIIGSAFSRYTDARLKELVAKKMVSVRPSVLHADFQACNEFDVMERISQIRAPTLVICGQEDLFTPPRYSQYLSDQIPRAEVRFIAQAGHMVMLEQPQSVANALMDFFTSFTFTPGQMNENNKG